MSSWDELFSLAQGSSASTTSTNTTTPSTTAATSRSNTLKRKLESPKNQKSRRDKKKISKRKRSEKKGETSQDFYNSFEQFLSTRTQVNTHSELSHWCNQLQEPFKACSTQISSKDNNKNQLPFHYKLRPVSYVSLLRNYRCIAHILAKDITQLNSIEASLIKSLQQCIFDWRHFSTKLTQESSTQNVQKAVHELQISIKHKSNKLKLIHEKSIQLIIACDDAYYNYYYLQITNSKNIMNKEVPHPLVYFELSLDTSSQQNTNYHVLSKIHAYRQLETCQLISTVKFTNAKPTIYTKFDQRHETIAPKLIVNWRDSCRDFLCHLYAYATLSSLTVEMIADYCKEKNNHSSILELGAGTGYLAWLLRTRYNVKVQAYDIAATGNNEYHGNTPLFTNVSKMTKHNINQVITKYKQSVLLLCYPPPNDSFAYKALLHFVQNGGMKFIYIGEFRGLTANTQFEELLRNQFTCVKREPCLRWGTDASFVSFWQKKQDKSTRSLLLPCTVCLVKEASKRVRFDRCLCYCSKQCFIKDEMNRIESFQKYQRICLDFDLDYENEHHLITLYD